MFDNERENSKNDKKGKTGFYFLLTLTTIFWGGAFPAGKIVADMIPPATAAFIRFSLALPIFFILTKVRGDSIFINKKNHMYAALFGLLQVTSYNFLFFNGLQFTTSSNATLIIAFGPALTTIIASFLYKDEKLSRNKIIGVILAFGGVVFIVLLGSTPELESNFKGDFIIFLAALVFAVYTLYSKIILNYMSPFQLTSWGTFYGVIALFFLTIPEKSLNFSLSGSLLLAMLYLSIFAGVFGFLFYNIGAKEIGPTRVAIFINLVPVFGVITSVIILGEILTIWHGISFIFILTGVLLVNKK